MFAMSMFYYRIYDSRGRLLVSTRDFAFAREFFYKEYNPMCGPYQFFVGGFMDDLAPFLSFEYPQK